MKARRKQQRFRDLKNGKPAETFLGTQWCARCVPLHARSTCPEPAPCEYCWQRPASRCTPYRRQYKAHHWICWVCYLASKTEPEVRVERPSNP